jgi:hypothetical protein
LAVKTFLKNCARRGNVQLPGSREKWNRFRGRGQVRPRPLERGKERQLKPSEDRDNMKKEEEEEPIWT